MTEQLPLAGFTIVEASAAGAPLLTRLAIAMAGRLAADLGASVLALRSDADPLAGCGPHVAGRSALAGFLGLGKAALAPAALPAAIAEAHGLLTDDPALAAGGPPVRVLVATGLDGDAGLPPAEEIDVLADGGLLDIIGDPAREPLKLGGHQAAYTTGLGAFTGLVAALTRLARDGVGEVVDVSARDVQRWVNWKTFGERLYTGRSPARRGDAAEWRVMPCRDGHATLIYLDKDWPALCRMIAAPALDDPRFATRAGRLEHAEAVIAAVAPWFAARTRTEIYDAAKQHGLPIAPVWSVAELAGDPQYVAQDFVATIDLPALGRVAIPTAPLVWNGARVAPRAGPAPAAPRRAIPTAGTPRAPLAGLRVLDLGIITAGASTSALLADLGADVMKVEAGAYIDPFRMWDGRGEGDWWNRSRFFRFTNRNKRGLGIDLKQSEGRALFLRLAGQADIVVENFRRGVLERLGFGWAALQAANPRLILASITSQGERGPDRAAASYGSTLEATSGLAALTGYPGGPPVISGITLNYPDQICSIFAAGAIVAAVLARASTGRGIHLDLSQRELASFLLGEHVVAGSRDTRLGNGDPDAAWQGCLRCADGRWIALRLADAGRQAALARVTGGTDPQAWAADRTVAAAVAALAAAGLRATPVRDGHALHDAVLADPGHAFARDPAGDWAKGYPFQFRGAPLAVARPSPGLGEHTAALLESLLGLTPDAIGGLDRAGALSSRPN